MARKTVKITELQDILLETRKADKNMTKENIAKEMELHPSTFSRKLRRSTWTKSEKVHLEKILKVKFEH